MTLSRRALLYLFWLCPLPLWAQDEPVYLDVSISSFTPAPAVAEGITEGTVTNAPRAISVEIRNAEARYLALYLRYRLEAAARYGAVRVVPELDAGADLAISGTVLQSDGATLSLHLSARDSSGALWLDQDFSGKATPSSSLNADPLLDDDFAALFSEILRALDAQLAARSPAQLDALKQQALLRYGESLLPDYFANFFALDVNGNRTLIRLPAANDPLLQRISAIREREYLFIDVVDEQYRRFFEDLRPVYRTWRSLRREQLDGAARVTERESSGGAQFRRGSYFALQESYDNYRWAKLDELYLDELSTGFTNETEPTQIELDDSLFRLSGNMAQQQREWRGILAELLALELQGNP
ncbi:MAG: hypothetical protein LBE21_09965 [Pseudomonadales bacterium]|jgi:hypothetical protein|nr:hypothetical protein [Pseudomonadales bacterium]